MKIIKKTVIFLIVVCLFLQILPIGNLPANYVWAEDDSSNAVKIDEENFPDDYFRTYVLNQFDSDKNGILDAVEQNAVTSVSVANKSVKSLSGIEYFNNLTTLTCYSNQLENLDVSKNAALEYLDCSYNQLTELETGNTALTYLDCSSNQLTGLDLSNNTALTELQCSANPFTELDVSKNTALKMLWSSWGELKKLDVSGAAALEYLYCHYNQLTELDVSNNTALVLLSCDENPITSLDVSNNAYLTHLRCYRSPLKNLDVSNNTALTYLLCAELQLTSLDVSNNTALEYLYCYGNQLENLDVSNNTALRELYCYGNQLENLDVSENPALSALYCYGNQLKNLDVSKNPALIILYCNNNQLENLDVSKNTALRQLYCDGNHLENLDVSKNTALEVLYCHGNQLDNLDVSNNTALKYLHCYGNQLKNLDVSENAALGELYCYDNQLKNLDVSKNAALKRLYCHENQLPYLDLRGNSVTELACDDNIYYINNASIDTSTIEGFDIKKASDWKNAEVNGTIVSVIDPNERITYTYQVSDSKSITFSFQVVTFQVTFQDGDTVASEQTVIYGEAAEAPVLSKTGYILSWDKSFDNITEDTTVNAVWTANNYAIHYELNGGENNSSNPNEYTIESSTITLKNPSRTGYTFDGWYTDSALTEKVTEIAGGSIGDKTLYAKWSAVKYTINYQLNGGENNSSNPNEYTIESSTITLKNPSRTGYTFGGWYADRALTKKVTEIAAGSTGEKTFYAKWSANKYKVNFDKNGGSIKTSDKTKTYTYGSKYKSLPKAARKNYEFVGWYTKKSGGSKITSNSVVNITKTTTFYARWKKVTVGKAAIHKLTNPKANQIKVSIKKVSGADGYEVLYSVNSKFKSSKKTTVKSTGAALKNLKKGRTYYVKIRAYKKDSTGNIIYGKYSKVSKKEVTK